MTKENLLSLDLNDAWEMFLDEKKLGKFPVECNQGSWFVGFVFACYLLDEK